MEQKGIVFDIQRFSLNDGPGIRTTVFLKGCPLNCLWCHNPESISPKKQLSFNSDKCVYCGTCMDVCPSNSHFVQGEKHTINFETCNTSGLCVEFCNYDALKIYGREMLVSEVMEMVLRDTAYYSSSGGGLTISGGEPMFQAAFSLELLKAAKKKKIHTCMDTSGYVAQSAFEKVLAYTDLFHYDFKAGDAHLHETLTGVDNRLILDNLNFISEHKARIILRCPVIPEANYSESHLESIIQVAKKTKGIIQIDLLPYHNFGVSKNKQIGQESLFQTKENIRNNLDFWKMKIEKETGLPVKLG
jgi:glycyl-radical enzyme activating protein